MEKETKVITKVLVEYLIFANISISRDGKKIVKVNDFSGDSLFNDVLKDDYNLNSLMKNQVIENGNLVEFSLGKFRIVINYNEKNLPIRMMVSSGNIKEIEYYDDDSVKNIRSFNVLMNIMYFNVSFTKGELVLQKGN